MATFERVLIQRGGLWHATTEEEFSSLPLAIRIRHVLEKTVVFHRNGEPIEAAEALAILRRHQAMPTSNE